MLLLPLAAAGCRWLPLAAAGCRWLPLAAAGCRWLPLAAAGYRWLPLSPPLTLPLLRTAHKTSGRLQATTYGKQEAQLLFNAGNALLNARGTYDPPP